MTRWFWSRIERAHRRAASDWRSTRDRAALMVHRHESAARTASKKAHR